MKYEVDKHIEGIYLDILRKMLENPDNWTPRSEIFNHYYQSPYINEEDEVRFITLSSILTMTREGRIEIYKNESKIYELEIPWREFKIRRLLRELYAKKDYDTKQKKIRDTNNLLTSSLGAKMERYIKLTKIRKKL